MLLAGVQGPFASSSYWFKKMYYSNIGPHARGLGGKILMYENSQVIQKAVSWNLYLDTTP